MTEQTLSLYWMTPRPATALPGRTVPRRRRTAGKRMEPMRTSHWGDPIHDTDNRGR